MAVARRNFLRDAVLAASSAFAAIGVAPALASASSFGFAQGRGERREERAYAIPGVDGTLIDKENDVIITRWQGRVYAHSLACPHQNTAIRWLETRREFECPKHHSRFTADGAHVEHSGRATRGLDRFAVHRDGATIVVNLDRVYQEGRDDAERTAAFLTI